MWVLGRIKEGDCVKCWVQELGLVKNKDPRTKIGLKTTAWPSRLISTSILFPNRNFSWQVSVWYKHLLPLSAHSLEFYWSWCNAALHQALTKIATHIRRMANNKQLLSLIVIVNSRFLLLPQKRNRGNQLIHRRLSKTKSIGSGSDPESKAGRQSDVYGARMGLELRRGGRWEDGEMRMNQDRICWRA